MGKSQRKFSKAMVMVVSLTGLVSTVLLLNDPPLTTDSASTPEIFQTNSNRMISLRDRAIASDESAVESPAPHLIELSCGEGEQVFQTGLTRLRLKGPNCGSSSDEYIQTSIRNLSNGYVATVFHKTDLSFTTDFINLSEGKNEIQISFQSESQPVTKKVWIDRAPASAKK